MSDGIQNIAAIVQEEIFHISGIDKSYLKESARLNSLGLDSLKLMQVKIQLEEVFKSNFDEILFAVMLDDGTIRDLSSQIYEKLEPSDTYQAELLELLEVMREEDVVSLLEEMRQVT